MFSPAIFGRASTPHLEVSLSHSRISGPFEQLRLPYDWTDFPFFPGRAFADYVFLHVPLLVLITGHRL